MFVLPVGLLLSEIERLAPDMLAACRDSIGNATSDLDFLRLSRAAFSPRHRFRSTTR